MTGTPAAPEVRSYSVVLTPAQLRAYVAVCVIWDRDGRVTLRGLCDRLGMTINGVRQHVVRLRAAGWVDFANGRSATLRPLRRVEIFADALAVGAATRDDT